MTMVDADRFCIIVPYGDQRIPCEVRRSRDRSKASVAIHVEPDGSVLVEAPWESPASEIRRALIKRSAWMSHQLSEIGQRLTHVLPRQYVSGESVYYLGRRYCLKVLLEPDATGAKLRRGCLEVRVAARDPSVVRKLVESWYRVRAMEKLHERMSAISHQLPWIERAPPLTIRRMVRQWGSCSPRGRISLNTSLIRAPGECIDYVILHELCHLRIHNHSPQFYGVLTRHMPGWRKVKHRLDRMAESLLVR